MLKLNNLYKKYQRKGLWAVEDLSLLVPKGELLALVGESGSGKTTLLRLIAGFEVPEQGSISINEQEVFSAGVYIEPEKRRIGMVFQDYALFPHLTVKENILFGLKKVTQQQKENRLQELLALVELTSQASKFPHELSGGQQQRVALARALAPAPDILLLDEPFSNLDEVLKEQMRREMRRIIKNSGLTAIFVTHDTRDALTTADRIVILKDGRIHQADSPSNIYRQPANAYVAGFFGQVNLLPAKRTAHAYQTSLGPISTSSPQPAIERDVMLCIRPEQIEVCTEQEAQFKGTVVETTYLGSYSRILLQTTGSTLLLHMPFYNAEVAPGQILNCRINANFVSELTV